MKLNGIKCKEMIISFVRNEIAIPGLRIDELTLELVDSFKALGLIINNKLKWQNNTEAIVKKASKRLYMLLAICDGVASLPVGLSPSDLLLVYLSLVRSILEYACPVWHTALSKFFSDKIGKVQKGPSA